MDIEPIRSAYIDHWKRIIDVAEFLGSHHITFHPLSPPSFERADTGRNDFETEFLTYYGNVFAENVTRLDEHSETVFIAIENHKFGAAVRTGLEMVLLKTERVGLTLDIPKLYSSDEVADSDSLSVFVRHRDRIVEIHAHDFEPGRMQHMEVGTGCIEFSEYASFFSRTEAWTTVEVRPAEAAARSRDRLVRDLGLV